MAPRRTRLPGQVPDEVREERRARLMQLQQNISAQRLQRKVGTVQRVLIDEVGPTVATGRTTADAPEIDGIVEIRQRADESSPPETLPTFASRPLPNTICAERSHDSGTRFTRRSAPVRRASKCCWVRSLWNSI